MAKKENPYFRFLAVFEISVNAASFATSAESDAYSITAVTMVASTSKAIAGATDAAFAPPVCVMVLLSISRNLSLCPAENWEAA